MNGAQILAPMTVLALWGFAVLLVPILRFRSVARGAQGDGNE